MEEELERHPSTIYCLPIITVKSQSPTLVCIKIFPILIHIKPIDYGSGKDPTTFLSWLFKLTSLPVYYSNLRGRVRRNLARTSSSAGGDPRTIVVTSS